MDETRQAPNLEQDMVEGSHEYEPPKGNRRLRVGVIALLVAASILGLRSCMSPTTTVVNMPASPVATPEQVQASTEVAPDEVPPPIKQAATQRNVYFASLNEAVDGLLDDAIAARTLWHSQQATIYVDKTGNEPEQYYLDRINDLMTRSLRENKGRKAFTGAQASKILPTIVELQSLLRGLEAVYAEEQPPSVVATPNPVWKRANDFLIQAYMAVGTEQPTPPKTNDSKTSKTQTKSR